MCSPVRHVALLMLAGGSVGGARAHGQDAPPVVRVTVSGVVGDFQTGGPVVGAFVKVDGDVGGITDDAGKFRVELAPGAHWFDIRRMGYQPRTFEVRLEPHVLVAELRVALTQVPLDLPEVIVKADRTRLVFGDQRGFYRRQRLGTGHFLTRADIEARLPQVLSDLLRPIPGVEIYQSGIEDARIRMKSRLPSCQQETPLVFLDGIEVWAPSLDALVPIQFVEAIEVYTSSVNLPAELARFGAACGVIVVWTRH
ncbi:MAG: carboxypeptidase regulatory-like domain-containing protein [Gemmatimonadetes bacterium]|nr:carboxypeptidase regulatory-like domain-containing protein [Gemmatimonadota bacterium]